MGRIQETGGVATNVRALQAGGIRALVRYQSIRKSTSAVLHDIVRGERERRTEAHTIETFAAVRFGEITGVAESWMEDLVSKAILGSEDDPLEVRIRRRAERWLAAANLGRAVMTRIQQDLKERSTDLMRLLFSKERTDSDLLIAGAVQQRDEVTKIFLPPEGTIAWALTNEEREALTGKEISDCFICTQLFRVEETRLSVISDSQSIGMDYDGTIQTATAPSEWGKKLILTILNVGADLSTSSFTCIERSILVIQKDGSLRFVELDGASSEFQCLMSICRGLAAEWHHHASSSSARQLR